MMESVVCFPLGFGVDRLFDEHKKIGDEVYAIQRGGEEYLCSANSKYEISKVGYDGKDVLNMDVRKSYIKRIGGFSSILKEYFYEHDGCDVSDPMYENIYEKAKILVPKKYHAAIAIRMSNSYNPADILVYPKGGFFAKHTDRKDYPTMFATVIILIPSIDSEPKTNYALRHTGGVLRVWDMNNKLHEFASENYSEAMVVAFHPQLEHECTEVTSGFRMILKFSLHLDEHKMNFIDTMDSINDDEIFEAKIVDGESINKDLDELQKKINLKILKAQNEIIRTDINDVETILDNLRSTLVGITDKIENIIDSIPKDYTESFQTLMDKINNLDDSKMIAVRLINYYSIASPSFLYPDDLRIYNEIRKRYSKIILVNETYDENPDEYHKYNSHIIDIQTYNIINACEDCGRITEGSKYNDSSYDTKYTYQITHIIINPANKKILSPT